jgi:hypothetical protein
MCPLGGRAGLAQSRGSRTKHHCKHCYCGERLSHCCELKKDR